MSRIVAAPESRYRDPNEAPIPLPSNFIERLLRSHAELCASLRLAGRQILRLNGDQESLDKIREALKHAETLRKVLKNPDQAEILDSASPDEASPALADMVTAPTDKPERKSPSRLSRPHPHRVLRFPSGESSR